MGNPTDVEMEAAKFLQKLIQESTDEPTKLAVKLHVILQHMKTSGKENSMPYQVISRAMETVINEHGLDIEALASSRAAPASGAQIGGPVSSQGAGPSERTGITADPRSFGGETGKVDAYSSGRPLVGTSSGGLDIYQGSSSNISGGAKARGVAAGASLHQPVDTGVSVPMQYSNSVYDNPNFVANMHKDGMGSYSAAPLPVDLSSSKTIGGKELLNDGGGNLLSKANKSIQGDIPSNASESSVPRSAALRDTGKSPSVQAPIPCMPFKDHQLKQLRAQCLVFLAFRNGVTPRKPHLEIALGNFFLKEDVPHRDLVDHKGKEQSIQDPSNVLESSRPSGMLDNSSSTDKSFARQPIGNHLETNLLKDAENCTSVQEERSTQQAMLSEHGKDRRHPSVLMRNSEADIATRHTLESQGSPFRGMQTDFNARNISASSREDNLSNIQQRVGVPNQAHFGMGQAKHVRPDLANWSGNSWQMEASKASISASAMMYDSQFQRRENAVDLCSPADFHNQWRPISVTDGQNNQGAPCRDSDVIFRNITPAQDMDLEEEDASATADKPPSPKYTTYEKWIFERQKRKHLTDQAWAVKQQKTEQKIAASFEKLKENVSSSEDISAKTKSVIELKKLQLLDLQRRLRSEILDDFFNPAAPAIDRVKSIKKTRIGRRSKQLEKYEQKMKEERMKRVRERQKDFFSEVEVHRERLEDASKMKKERWKVFNKYAKEFHKRKERIHREKIDRIQREKINLLKINDVEGYLRMVQDAKSDRVKQLLKETEKYLAKLSSKLQEAKSVARRFESDMDETRMPNFLENNETTLDNEDEADQAKNYLESNEKYYKMAHSVKEHVAGQPSILVGGKLREYQMNGLRWLVSLYNNNLNGILADEMGLGKTVQVISLMCYLMETKNDRGPFLVVVPSSVLPGWESEINFWAPSMHKIIYSGPPEERRKLFKEQILHQKFNVLLTTYEYLMNKHDRPKLSKVLWHYIIIDEGHRIKNASCKLNADLKHYRSSHRLLLTGTPLQNNLEELWALLNFLLPNIFNSSEDFSHWFNKPFQSGDSSPDEALLSEEENLLIINRLHQVLRPFVLRRLKHKVENELPEKIERLVRCEASAYQKLLMKRVEENLGAIGTSKARSVHNSVMELRNICNHPYLSQLHIEEVHDYMPKHYLPHVIRLCGKLEMLDRLLPKLKETDHRVLLFSTMTRLLDVMEEYLCWKQYKYLRLDGHTSGGDRGALIDNFNKSGSPFFIFLLSIRAGGVGVNLQAADTVIIFDTDWNPQVDLQAQARAHRIGQKKDVLVLRLETVQTVEEQVRASAEHKLGVANQSITAGFFDNNTSAEDRREYLESLLRECKKEEAAPVLDDDALNYLIARSESEIDVFESIDKRRKEEETALWSKLAGGDGAEDIEQFPSLPARLLTYDELKPFYEAMNISEAPRPVVVQTAAMKRKGDGLVSLDNQNYGRGKRAREVRSYEEQWTEDEFDKICLVEGPDSPHMKEESGDKNLASVMDGSVMPSSSTQSQPPQQLVNQSYHSPLGTPPVKRGRGRPRKTVTNTYMPSSPGAPLSSSGLSSSGASFFSRPPVSSGSPLSSMTPVSSGGPLFPTAPVSSGAPSSSGAPVSSAAPSSSGEPLSSGAPSSSGAPVSSGVPVTSAGPKTSEAPVSSVAPLSSAEPSSGAPVSSEAPLLSGAEQTTAAAKVDVVPGFQVTSGPASIPGKITSVSVLHSGLSSVDSIGQPVVASQPNALPDPTMPVQGQGRGRGRGRGRGGGRGRGRGRGRGAKVESSGEDPMPIGRGENASVPVSVLPPGALVASKIDLETQGGSILEPSTPHPVSKLPDMAETTVTGPSVSLPPSLASAKGPSASPVPSLASSTGPSASPVPSLASSTGPSASPLPSLAASTTGTSVSSLPSLASSTGPSVSPLPSLASSTAPSVSPLPSLAASTGPSVSPLPSLAASTEPSVSPLPSLASTTGPSVSPLPSLASTIGASVSPRPSLASTRANLVPDPDFPHGPAAVAGPLPPSGDGSRRRGRRKTTVLSTAPPAPISPATSLKNMETKREADSISARSPPDLDSQSLISPEASKTALDVSSSLPQDKSDIRSQQGADGNMLSPPTTISSPGSLPVTAADKQDLVVRNVPSSNPISDLPSGSVVSSSEPATPSAGTKSGRGRGRKTQSGVQASRGRGRRQRSVTPGIPEALTDQNPQSPVTPPNLQSPVTPPNLQSTVTPQNLESTVTPQNVQSTVTPQKRVRVSSIGRRPATRSKPDNTETPISVVQPTASQSPHPVIREVSENKQEAQAQKSIDIIQPKVSDISVDSLVQTIPEAKQVDKTHDVEAPAERLSDPTVTQTVDKKHEDVLSIPVIHDQSNSMDDSEVAINSKSVGGNEDQKQKQLSSQSSVDSSVARTAVSEHGAEVENVVSVQVNEGELTTDTPTSASVVESDSVKIVAENISHVTKVADVQEHEGREDNEGDRLTTVVDSDMDRSVMDPSAVQVSVEVQETRVKEPHNVDKLNQSESNSYPQVEEAGNSKVDEIQKQTEGGLSETVQMTADPIVSDVQSVAIVEHVDEGHECKTGEEGGTEAGPNNESENLVEEQLNNVSVSQDGLALIGETIAMGSVSCSISFNPLGQPPVLDRNPILSEDEDAAASPVFSNTSLTQLTASTTVECTLPPEASNDNLDPKIEEAAEKNSPLEMKNDGSVNYSGLHDTPAHAVKPLEEMMDFENIVTGQHSGEECSRSRDSLNVLHIPGNVTPINDLVERSEIQSSVPGEVDEKEHSGGSVTALFTSADTPAATSDLALYKSEDLCHEEDREEVPSSSSRTVEQLEPESNAQVREEATYVQEKIDTSVKGSPSPTNNLAVESELGKTGKGSNPSEDTCKDGTASSGEVLASLDVLQQVLGENASLLQSTGTRSVSSAEKLEIQVLESVDISCREHEAKASPLREQDKSNIVVPIVEHVLEELPNIDEAVVPVPEAQADSEKLVTESSVHETGDGLAESEKPVAITDNQTDSLFSEEVIKKPEIQTCEDLVEEVHTKGSELAKPVSVPDTTNDPTTSGNSEDLEQLIDSLEIPVNTSDKNGLISSPDDAKASEIVDGSSVSTGMELNRKGIEETDKQPK